MFNFKRYTKEQLMARMRFLIGIMLAMTLCGTMMFVMYAVVFSPVMGLTALQAKLLDFVGPIATFLVGTLSSVMLNSRSDHRKDEEE